MEIHSNDTVDVASPNWQDEAGRAAQAVAERFILRPAQIPGTKLGATYWPMRRPRSITMLSGRWNFWWQAHLIDCAIDAALRTHQPQDERLVRELIRGHYMRNMRKVTNDYYDDMAWLALALRRASTDLHIEQDEQLAILDQQFQNAWTPQFGGGIKWRLKDYFYNAPAAGPVGIFHARSGNLGRAQEISDWVFQHLFLPDSGLIADGLHVNVSADGTWEYADLETPLYTYSQGVILGIELELLLAASDPTSSIHAARATGLVHAIAYNLSNTSNIKDKNVPVLITHGAGDGGLFTGILARYLAQVALHYPGTDDQSVHTRAVAKELVLGSALSVYTNARDIDGKVFFPEKWDSPVNVDQVRNSRNDLSVQLSGWMLYEAAALLTRTQ